MRRKAGKAFVVGLAVLAGLVPVSPTHAAKNKKCNRSYHYSIDVEAGLNWSYPSNDSSFPGTQTGSSGWSETYEDETIERKCGPGGHKTLAFPENTVADPNNATHVLTIDDSRVSSSPSDPPARRMPCHFNQALNNATGGADALLQVDVGSGSNPSWSFSFFSGPATHPDPHLQEGYLTLTAGRYNQSCPQHGSELRVTEPPNTSVGLQQVAATSPFIPGAAISGFSPGGAPRPNITRLLNGETPTVLDTGEVRWGTVGTRGQTSGSWHLTLRFTRISP